MLNGLRRRPRAFLPVLATALVAVGALGVSGCLGGGGGDAKQLIEKAFQGKIDSAKVKVDLELKLDGLPQLAGPIRAKLEGPFKSGGDEKLPSLDWKLSFTGGGQSFDAGLVSTGDNAFVSFRGTSYEVGEKTVGQLNSQLAKQRKEQGNGGGQSLEKLGIKPVDWVKDADEKGDEKIAGVDTEHVSASIDVGKMLDDVNEAIGRAPRQVAGRAVQAPQKLTDAQKKQIEDVVKDPRLDVYVGKDDELLRRASVELKLEVPEAQRAQLQGFQGGTLSFSVELADVNKPVEIEAPRGAKPIGDLTRQLGGALGGLGGGAGAGAGGTGGGAGGPSAPGGGAGSGATGAESEQFQRYLDCVRKAGSDNAKLEACSKIIQ